jgi:hypothetical protein
MLRYRIHPYESTLANSEQSVPLTDRQPRGQKNPDTRVLWLDSKRQLILELNLVLIQLSPADDDWKDKDDEP